MIIFSRSNNGLQRACFCRIRVKHYKYSDTHLGFETGLVCEEHHDALISGVLSGPGLTAHLGVESTASPDDSLEVAYLVWGDYDRGGTYRAPRITRIAPGEVLVEPVELLQRHRPASDEVGMRENLTPHLRNGAH